MICEPNVQTVACRVLKIAGFGLLSWASVACTTRHDNAPQPFTDAQGEMKRAKELKTASMFPKTMERSNEKYTRAGDLYEDALKMSDSDLKAAKISEASALAEESHQLSKSANGLASDIPNWDEDIFGATRKISDGSEADSMRKQIENMRAENRALNEKIAAGTDLSSSPLARVQDLRFNGSVAFFRLNKANLETPFRTGLGEIADTVRQSSSLKVKVMGYADSTGNKAINERLSMARAQSVKTYLESKGVSPSQINVEAFGARQPLKVMKGAGKLQLERRVDILVEAVR
jgi:outer membrane protein OmpA-like peptidoglycan-associated protein